MLACNSRDLLASVEQLQAQGVELISMREAVDAGTPQGCIVLTVFGILAEPRWEIILQHRKEGIAIVKVAGKSEGGRR